MTSKNSKKVAEAIRDIANGKGAGLRFPIMSGKVKAGSIDSNNMTCTVLLDVNDASNPTPGVRLNTVSLNSNGVILYPADGSNVLVGEVNGPGAWALIKCSDLVKMVVTIGGTTFTISDGKIQMNDGSKGGLTITPELTSQLNKLNTLVSHLVSIIAGSPITEPGNGAPSALQQALKAAIAADAVGDFSNIENKAITQG